MKKCLLRVLFLIVLVPNVVVGQATNAAITGQVVDPSKALITQARVTAINNETNVRYEGTTNKSGTFLIPSLPPGDYRIEVEKAGFRTIVKPDVILHVQDTVQLNFDMALGSTSETVTVQGGAPMVDTESAAVSTTIDRNFAENLPLNGRSFQTLLLLTPGTVLISTNGGGDNGGTFSINGQRANANSFSVDGVSANLGGFVFNGTFSQLNGANPSFTTAGTTQGMVSVDALQEFKIQTSTYAAEFGRQPGGQVSLLTRSGTNDFHGTAFDYLRNDPLDANNWFNGYTSNPPIPKGKERQNDFGGTLGGPIFKDKTFFFFSYEGLRLLQPDTEVDHVPSLRLRQEAAQAYQAILDSWPIPDGPEFLDQNGNPTGASPYTFSQSFPTNLDSYIVKIDHTLGKRLHFFGSYSDTSSAITSPNPAPNGREADKVRSRALTLGVDTAIRSNLQNELRLNYSVNVSTRVLGLNLVGGAKAFDNSTLFPAPLVPGPDRALWRVSLPGVSALTAIGSFGRFSQRQINVVDNLSYSLGPHQLKWGVDYRRLFPIAGASPLLAVYTIRSESDLIGGVVSLTGIGSNFLAHPIFTNFSAFAEDTWRISDRLTVNYGLRWELNPAPGERDGIQPLNVIGLNAPATATLAPLNSSLYKTTYNNFAPRIGLAFQLRQSPGNETVVRGGFGVFYDLNSETAAGGFSAAPFTNTASVTDLPFPIANNVLPIPVVPVPLMPPFAAISAIDPNLKLPYTLQWNFSIQQGLGQNQSLTASYVASAGRRLLRSDSLVDFNADFTAVTDLRNASSSSYQSLQLQFNRRLSYGLQGLASYTYSHAIDDASDGQIVLSASPTGARFLNPHIDQGNATFDLRHAFRGALTYNIPTWTVNFLSKAVLGKWSVDTIGIAQTGLPVDLIGGFYFPSGLPDGFFQLRPNTVPGQPLYLQGSQCAAANGGASCPGGMGFNPAAFLPVPQDVNGNPTQAQGTFGRNVMRGFGAWQMDLAVHRQFNLTERVNLQFRGEFFNVFNHPNFGGIDGNLTDVGTFGLAASTLNRSYGAGLNSLYQIGGPRSIQLALKLAF